MVVCGNTDCFLYMHEVQKSSHEKLNCALNCALNQKVLHSTTSSAYKENATNVV